ncbi:MULTISPECIES: GntP family permease [unclassified Sporosarcina]|uniref:GntP family permease n=1 Tax=unclassified Sporosarcina TaxID=2647733 RepID=UPI0020422848|nr:MULTISPECIES: gluconate:H+ symporter [unclassified Sporosarcina]GKV65309.1 gluconate permease [Sporosarcina sp. NCCP-2331]GLB55433.1 gluconate permease [Sporosarcina sp. NCCP-2378]
MVEGNMLIIIFLLSLAALFFMILKLKIEPFVTLIIVAFVTALVLGFPLADIPGVITTGFGNTLIGVGILIGLGVIFGQFLGVSGAIEKIAEAVLRVFGIKRSAAGLSLTGIAVSIPVFFDAAFVILSGLVKSLARRTGISIVTFVTALGVGLIVSHSMIAPTPGPLVVAENTGADLGLFIFYGIICAIPATMIGGYFYGTFIGKRIKTTPEELEEDIVVPEKVEGQKEISTGLSFFMLGLPIILILLNTVTDLWLEEGTASRILGFIGDKNVALLISVIVALIVLKPYIHVPYNTLYDEAINSAGMIILVTGAGGAFGAVINQSGIGDYLIETMQGWSIPVLVLAFIFSQILRASLGSATVALVTTSSILGPMTAELGVSPILLGLAICAGAIGLSLPNDSGFWVVNKFGRLTIPQTIQAWSIGGFIAGLSALGMVYLLDLLSGFLPGL